MAAERNVTTAAKAPDKRRDVNRSQRYNRKTGRRLFRDRSRTEETDVEARDEGPGHLRSLPRKRETLQVNFASPPPLGRRGAAPPPYPRPSRLSIAVTKSVLRACQRSSYGNVRAFLAFLTFFLEFDVERCSGSCVLRVRK